MKPILIRLDPETREKLDTLSEQSGHPVAALIRWCIDKSLPTLADNLARSAANQSTIDSRPSE